MYAVERLGSYITRGVYTVSGPFHPFGGAVDIIVVEQPDGSFKSSPWYVRFGKFQGVLKAREKIVTINVNGSDANFHMFLDPRGEAHFLREREEGEGESDVSYSSDDMDDQSQDSRMITESCSYDGTNSSSVIQFDGSNGKIVAVTNSQQSRISLRRSMKDDVYLKEDDNVGVVTMTTLETAEISADLVETFMLGEGDLGGKLVQVSESRDIDESHIKNADEDVNPEDVTAAVTCFNSRIPDIVETCPEKKLDIDQASDERDAVLSGVGIPEKENGVCRVQSSIYCETSSSLEMPYLANGGSRDSHSCVETLHSTSEQLTEDTGNCQAEDLQLLEKQSECTDMCPQQTNPYYPSICGHDRENLELPVTETSSYTHMVCTDGAIGSSEGESKGASSISGFSNSVDQTQDENGDEITRNMLPLHPGSVDSVRLIGDCGPTKVAKVPASESSDEDQFFLSDIDDFEPGKNPGESTFPDPVDKERFVQMNGSHKFESLTENSKVISSPISIPRRHTDHGPDGMRMAESLPNMWSDIDDLGAKSLSQPLSHSLESNSTSLPLNCTNSDTGNGNQSPHSNFNEEDTRAQEGDKDGVVNPAVEISLCKHLLYEGMGAEAASQAFDAEKLDINRLVSLGPEVVKNNRLVVRIRGHYFPWDAAAPVVLGIVAFGSENIFEPEGMIPVDQVEESLVGDPSKAIDASSGSWRIWPFAFRRSRSRKTMQPTLTETRSSDAGNASTNNLYSENDKRDVKDMKKMVKATAPTSEELSSLNLKEGSNSVIFTFSTAMLGKQKVDARIYLWKWNTRIVISDVDGTITKSDVLGQFMPLVGIDWSQTGVVHLFSAIKDNGYQFLYLSARSISQAYITRQFLVNLKQDGKALPDGPVVISPDGLFPSLYREVIRRAPHEFKIACLEDIKAVFPLDCSPFYAGFGNRDTDEISYLKVGIPKGKIFTINPKGEVAVNRLVDARSYTSLHALVHGMFPAMTSSEHVQEDYNSWNFWKLPPPHIDDI